MAKAEQTRSAELIAKARRLAHEERRRGEASELGLVVLEKAQEYEIAIEQALRAERTIHAVTKDLALVLDRDN